MVVSSFSMLSASCLLPIFTSSQYVSFKRENKYGLHNSKSGVPCSMCLMCSYAEPDLFMNYAALIRFHSVCAHLYIPANYCISILCVTNHVGRWVWWSSLDGEQQRGEGRQAGRHVWWSKTTHIADLAVISFLVKHSTTLFAMSPEVRANYLAAGVQSIQIGATVQSLKQDKIGAGA